MNMNPTAQAYLDQGNALYSQGRFEEAISRYSRVLEINPRSADAFNNWGFALSAMGRFDEAGVKYSKAIEINPQSSQAYYNWGNALRRQNKQEDAIAKYKKAVEINPNYSLAYNNWGVVLDSQGKYEEAMAKYSQAITTNPGYSQAYNNWGFALDALGKYEESIAKYMKATEIDVNYSDAYDNWGNALSALGRYGEAVLKYSKAISINPNHSEAYYNWGLALYYQSRYDEAAVKFNKAIQINPGYILAHFTLALDLYHLEKYADVQYIRIQTQKLMSSSPNHAIQLSHMVNAEIVRAEKKLARARTEYNKTELTEKVASMKKVLELFVPPAPKEIMPVNLTTVQQQQQPSPTQSPLQSTPTQKPNYQLYPPKELEITRSISPTTSSPTFNSSSPTLNNSPNGGSPTLNPSSPTFNNSYDNLSPTLPVINPQSTQKQAFAEPALSDYYEFLSEELTFFFKKIFSVRDNKLEEKYDVLLPILSYVTSCVSPFNSLSYADKVFPFLTKIAPDGLKLEDLLQIKRVNKIAAKFVAYFSTFDEVDQIVDKLARDLTSLRKDELIANYKHSASIKTLDKVKRAKEKGIFSKSLVINASEELAFIDLNIILILCFLEGLKVPDYFSFTQKTGNITNAVTRRMKVFFDNQSKEEPIFV